MEEGKDGSDALKLDDSPVPGSLGSSGHHIGGSARNLIKGLPDPAVPFQTTHLMPA